MVSNHLEENAVSRFQQNRGVEPTGEINIQTWEILMGTQPKGKKKS
jgi:Putative peptidoglycan binding domain